MGMDGCLYYIWTQRYYCNKCAKSFLGYDPEAIKLLPPFVQHQFPAIMTRKFAIDKKVGDKGGMTAQVGVVVSV